MLDQHIDAITAAIGNGLTDLGGAKEQPNKWAPVHSSSAGPYIFVLSEGFLIDTSSISGPDCAWPLRFDPVDMVGLLAAQ